MEIKQDDWQDASGSYVQDTTGRLWRIIGFIDRPAVILDPVAGDDQFDERRRQTVIMGSLQSQEFTRLVPEKTA
jgi:hypothetical protein